MSKIIRKNSIPLVTQKLAIRAQRKLPRFNFHKGGLYWQYNPPLRKLNPVALARSNRQFLSHDRYNITLFFAIGIPLMMTQALLDKRGLQQEEKSDCKEELKCLVDSVVKPEMEPMTREILLQAIVNEEIDRLEKKYAPLESKAIDDKK